MKKTETLSRRADGRAVKKVVINGKSKYFYSAKKSDREAIKDINQQMIDYQYELQSKMSFSKIANAWNTEYRLTIPDANYRKAIGGAYARVCEYFDDVRDISKLETADIDTFIRYLKNRNYSKKTIATHKSILNKIFDYAVLTRQIKFNPVKNIKLPQGLPQKKRELPSTEDLKEVNKHWEGFDLLPYMMLNTGFRKSEILALTEKSIDRKKNTITIEYHVIHDGNRPIYEKKTKTEDSERTVYVMDKVMAVIPKKINGFLFSMDGDGKEPLTKKAFDMRWESYCKKYGVSITSHQLRHGFATMCFEGGLSEKEAQVLLGHADSKITKDIYTHLRKEKEKIAVNKLNDFSF